MPQSTKQSMRLMKAYRFLRTAALAAANGASAEHWQNLEAALATLDEHLRIKVPAGNHRGRNGSAPQAHRRPSQPDLFGF